MLIKLKFCVFYHQVRICRRSDIFSHPSGKSHLPSGAQVRVPALQTFLPQLGEGTLGIQRMEARDSGKHPTRHRIAPCNRELFVKTVKSARVEKL